MQASENDFHLHNIPFPSFRVYDNFTWIPCTNSWKGQAPLQPLTYSAEEQGIRPWIWHFFSAVLHCLNVYAQFV